ncbi:Beta-hexosaminidase subunit beta [Fasciolopsis buskii]|uniref:beta-N-acetylhexosaminidase n=1 Tax=Fasciolopsis buskii TaxID=27845 RepID=A0A8E0RRM7_9TREM|nr:Beta-hexosaminidase subunit beta [Fasciolopsis buski]
MIPSPDALFIHVYYLFYILIFSIQNLIARLWTANPKFKRRMIVWEDALNHFIEQQNSVLIHFWKSDFYAAVQQGFNVISSTCWYLDNLWDVRKWPTYYLCDPSENPTGLPLLPVQQKQIFGGEACMWSEYQCDDTILQKIWPVTSAIAERLWSPSFVNNIETFGPRVEEMRCRLIGRGVPVGVLNGPGSCPSSGVLSAFVNPTNSEISPQDISDDAVDDLYRPLKSPWSAFAENKSAFVSRFNVWYCVFYYVLGVLTGIILIGFLSPRLRPTMMNLLGFIRPSVLFSRNGCLLLFLFILACFIVHRSFS